MPRAGFTRVGSSPARSAADLSDVSTVAVYESPWHALAAKSAPLGSNEGRPVVDRNQICPEGVTRRSILAASRSPSAMTTRSDMPRIFSSTAAGRAGGPRQLVDARCSCFKS